MKKRPREEPSPEKEEVVDSRSSPKPRIPIDVRASSPLPNKVEKLPAVLATTMALDSVEDKGSTTVQLRSHDASADKDPEGPPRQAREEDQQPDMKLMDFPVKLMSLLQRRVAPDALWFLPEGKAIGLEKTKFVEKILNDHFQCLKYTSAIRMFNRWYVECDALCEVPQTQPNEGSSMSFFFLIQGLSAYFSSFIKRQGNCFSSFIISPR